MRESADRPLRLSETARVEAFSDGVFAIIITLVLPVFYGITSDGIYELPVAVRRARSRRRSTNY